MIFQQGTDDILADIMDIAFDRRHQYFTERRHLLTTNLFLQTVEAGLHRLRREQHLRQENLVLAEAPADLFQPRQ